MAQLETGRSPALPLTQRQRWSLILSYTTIALGLLAGISQRDSALNAASMYSNDTAGITAQYPARWLLEESGDFVFRVRDMAYRGFKTSIEVSTLAAGADASARSLFDQLSLARAQVLIDYNVLGYEAYALPDETIASAMAYTFVAREASPFLQGVSAVARGLDILTVRRGQALIISFRADSRVYARELATLHTFIENLEY